MTRIPTDSGPEQPVNKQWRLGETPWRDDPFARPSARVIIDNDFSGDPDDLYQLVHHLLSPSVEIRVVVCSHLRPGDPFDPSEDSTEGAVLVARNVFARMGLTSTEVISKGAPLALARVGEARDGEAPRAIIVEALRDDTDLPLFYVAGGGLTDLASALLIEPRIASRMVLVWIGGGEHDGLASPPSGAMPIEYNLLIDVAAGQVVFASRELEIWQVPRDAYRQALVSDTELRLRVAATGPLGKYLYDEVRHVASMVQQHGMAMPETYPLGDSPLVLLTALRSPYEPDTSSSRHVVKSTPQLTADGAYRPMAGTRPMRVYTRLDVRLMFEDFYLKLEEFARWQG